MNLADALINYIEVRLMHSLSYKETEDAGIALRSACEKVEKVEGLSLHDRDVKAKRDKIDTIVPPSLPPLQPLDSSAREEIALKIEAMLIYFSSKERFDEIKTYKPHEQLADAIIAKFGVGDYLEGYKNDFPFLEEYQKRSKLKPLEYEQLKVVIRKSEFASAVNPYASTRPAHIGEKWYVNAEDELVNAIIAKFGTNSGGETYKHVGHGLRQCGTVGVYHEDKCRGLRAVKDKLKPLEHEAVRLAVVEGWNKAVLSGGNKKELAPVHTVSISDEIVERFGVSDSQTEQTKPVCEAKEPRLTLSDLPKEGNKQYPMEAVAKNQLVMGQMIGWDDCRTEFIRILKDKGVL